MELWNSFVEWWKAFTQGAGGKMVGMSLAYIASLMGMAFAWYNWRKREAAKQAKGGGK